MSRVIEKNIKEAVNRSRNIFDLYLLLYVFLKGREASVLSNYRGNEKLKVSKYQFQVKKILINDQFKIILTTESKEVLMDFIERYRFDEMALFALFMEIDLVFGEMNYEHSKANQESFGEKLEESKPLNTSVTRSLGLVHRVKKSFLPRF